MGPTVVKIEKEYWNLAHHQQSRQTQAHHEQVVGLRLQAGISRGCYYYITRSVFANDKFVKLMQDVTRQRKIFKK